MMLPPEPGNGRPALRWVPEELRHITLAFYGELPSGALDDLLAALSSALAPHPPLDLRLRGAGVFSARTLWAGVQDQAPSTHSRRNGPLADLMAVCEDAGRSVGAALGRQERRRAHLTVARLRSRTGNHRSSRGARGRHRGQTHDGGEQLDLLAEALAVYEGPVWTADEAGLMLSELGAGPGGGPRHQRLGTLPLTG